MGLDKKTLATVARTRTDLFEVRDASNMLCVCHGGALGFHLSQGHFAFVATVRAHGICDDRDGFVTLQQSQHRGSH